MKKIRQKAVRKATRANGLRGLMILFPEVIEAAIMSGWRSIEEEREVERERVKVAQMR